MKFLYTLICFIILSNCVHAQTTAEYYSGTESLSGYDLKNKLHQIISSKTTSWNYDQLPYYFSFTDRDSIYENDGSILDIYSENPFGPDPYNYSYEIPTLISGAGEEGLGWNREHIFSQSFFYGNYPMYSDMHLLVPTDARVNQRRSNLPFAKVGTVNWTSLNGSLVGLSSTPGYTLSVMEPIDEFKGDIARMLLYVAVRYETLIPYFQHTNSRCPFEERQEVALKEWQIALLKQWHEYDPVSPREIKRNKEIFAIQGNRNPFIDNPSWVEEIWPTASIIDSIAPSAPIYLEVVEKGSRFITFSWEMPPETGILGYQVYLNDSLMAVSKTNVYTFSDLDSNTTYSLSVRAYDYAYNYGPKSTAINVATLMTDTFASDLLLSKVIRGSGHNIAFEIKNNTGYNVDLRNYYLNMRQINSSTGSLYWSGNSIQFEGNLQQGKKLVLMHPEFNLPCFDVDSADIVSDGLPMRFDGMLAVALRKGFNDIDLFGVANNSDDSFAFEKSYYRKESVNNPITAFDTLQWIVHPVNYCDSLGNTSHPSSIVANDFSEFTIFPNPLSGDKLIFNGDELQKIEWIKVLNINGQVLKWEYDPFDNKNYLNIPDLPSGIYILITPFGSNKFIKN